jgi:HlyD family secretion protein
MSDMNTADSVKAVVGKPAKQGSHWGKRLLTLLVLAGLAGGGYYYYQQNLSKPSASITTYQTEPVKRGNISTTVTATGKLQPRNQVDIGTELSGTMDAVLVDDNDAVKKGQVLAKLKTNQLEDTITKMEASLAAAQAKVAQAKSQIAQTEAKILLAESNLKQGIASAKQSTVQIQKDNAQVHQNNAQLEQSNAQLQQSLIQVQKDTAQIQQNKAQIQQINAQIQQAKAGIAQAKASTLEARTKLSRLQTLQKDSGGKLPAKVEMDAAVAAWQKAQAAETSAVSNVQALQASLEGANATIETAKASIAAAKAGVNSAKAGVNAAKASVESAKTNVESAKLGTDASSANVEGLKAMVASAKAEKISAEAALESAQASVTEAKANLRSAQSDLAKATITSPIDGVVLTRSVEPGQTVASSLSAPTLFTLAEDLKQMELQISVDEADVSKVSAGQTAEFTVDAWAGRNYNATITRVSLGSTITDNVVTYLTKLTVDNSDLTLRPGMTATANIRTQSHDNVLLVPNAALRFSPPTPASDSTANDGGILAKLMPRSPIPSRPQGGNRGGRPRGDGPQQIWTLKDNAPTPITVKIGLSDNRITEIISDEVTEGMPIIIGTGDGTSTSGRGRGSSGNMGGGSRGAQP